MPMIYPPCAFTHTTMSKGIKYKCLLLWKYLYPSKIDRNTANRTKVIYCGLGLIAGTRKIKNTIDVKVAINEPAVSRRVAL